MAVPAKIHIHALVLKSIPVGTLLTKIIRATSIGICHRNALKAMEAPVCYIFAENIFPKTLLLKARINDGKSKNVEI